MAGVEDGGAARGGSAGVVRGASTTEGLGVATLGGATLGGATLGAATLGAATTLGRGACCSSAGDAVVSNGAGAGA